MRTPIYIIGKLGFSLFTVELEGPHYEVIADDEQRFSFYLRVLDLILYICWWRV